jgi:hypothetical protein
MEFRIITNGNNIDWNIIADLVVNVDVYSGKYKPMEAEISIKLSNKK